MDDMITDALGSPIQVGDPVSVSVGRYSKHIGNVSEFYETSTNGIIVRVNLYGLGVRKVPFLPKYIYKVGCLW